MCAKRRLTISSGYIGSGNKPSTFNRKPKGAYDKLRNRYISELEKERQAGKDIQPLSKEERNELKDRIKQQIKKEWLLDISKLVFSIILTIIIIYWLLL